MAKNDDSLNDFATLIWGKRSEGLPVPELNLEGEVTPHELQNIHQRYAFIQLLNPEAMGEYSEIKFIRSPSGWLILNYGGALSASPGEMLFNHGNFIKDEDGTFQRVCSGTGTIVLQIVNTAADAVRIAKNEEHWPTIHIVDGHPLMQWAVWKTAQDLHVPITGYVPSKEEEARYQRILQYCPETLVAHPEPTVAKP